MCPMPLQPPAASVPPTTTAATASAAAAMPLPSRGPASANPAMDPLRLAVPPINLGMSLSVLTGARGLPPPPMPTLPQQLQQPHHYQQLQRQQQQPQAQQLTASGAGHPALATASYPMATAPGALPNTSSMYFGPSSGTAPLGAPPGFPLPAAGATASNAPGSGNSGSVSGGLRTGVGAAVQQGQLPGQGQATGGGTPGSAGTVSRMGAMTKLGSGSITLFSPGRT